MTRLIYDLFTCYRSTTTTEKPLKETTETNFDPCEENSHIVIANEPQRSANHHLSLGAAGEPPICDRTILPGWYRFDSPAGNLIPSECPGENYCGTRKPVWLNGKFVLHLKIIFGAKGHFVSVTWRIHKIQKFAHFCPTFLLTNEFKK